MSASWIFFAQLCDVVGVDAAKQLCEFHGAYEWRCPRSARPCYPVAKTIGVAAFAALCSYFGDEVIVLPNSKYKPKKSEIIDVLRAGKRHRQIAQARLVCVFIL